MGIVAGSMVAVGALVGVALGSATGVSIGGVAGAARVNVTAGEAASAIVRGAEAAGGKEVGGGAGSCRHEVAAIISRASRKVTLRKHVFCIGSGKSRRL